MAKASALLLALALPLITRADVKVLSVVSFAGVCDASAGAMIDNDLFAAADDESNHIRIYSRSGGGQALADYSMSGFLKVQRSEPEADIEGAARVDDIIYWIGSHARNQNGKARPSRQRFFATRILHSNPPQLEPLGQPYQRLLLDLEQAPELAKLDLDEASELAPKEKHALNIEGLCARPDGALLIGFRNPIPKKHGILVPLLNPSEIVTNSAARARFGSAIRLDLDGRGIRDMVQRDGQYYIIGGAYNSADRFELYEWDGSRKPTLLYRWEKHTMNPEAVLALPGRPELLVLSDEGSKKLDGRECKDLPPANRSFRGVSLDPHASSD